MKILYYLLSLIYQLGIYSRNLLYELNILKSHNFKIPIISIGNITMGGTGKTPMTLLIFNQLILNNKKPCIVTRGYNRKSKELIVIDKNSKNYTIDQIGDEPLMMLKKNQAIQMVVYHNKIQAIQEAINQLDIDTIILDDGFQSLYISRDIDIVMINANQKNNQYNLFPLGNAREPIKNIKRADVVITNRGDVSSNIKNICVNNNIKSFQADNLFTVVGKDNTSIDSFDDWRVMAVCGIADPESFLNALIDLNIDVGGEFVVGDHYHYKADDINKIYQQMQEKECNTIITTWKDYYKIHPLNIGGRKIIILDMKLEVKGNEFFSIINERVNDY